MAVAQYAMVEELASLIKDNLSCKHLVLSVEEALVNFLQEDTSQGGVLELQPMSPYHRLLLHRLADIYGFAHESVGEGDDRHLVFERCPDTAIPSILVSDILWQQDEYHSPAPLHYILRRDSVTEPEKYGNLPSAKSFEEREAAYLAARERIFSLHASDEKETGVPKVRKIPVVAQRMIQHALGTKVTSNILEQKLVDASIEAAGAKGKCKGIPSSSGYSEETATRHHWPEKVKHDKFVEKSKRLNNVVPENGADNGGADFQLSKGHMIPREIKGRGISTENPERQQLGAAKRIFAHALGLTPGKLNQGPMKANHGNKSVAQGSV